MATAIAVVALVTAIGVGGGSAYAQGGRPKVCMELPAPLRSLCGGQGVSCTLLSDNHARWEAVFATEPTMGQAQKWLRRAGARGYSAKIEVDTMCSNGYGVYEVATAGFLSQASAGTLVAKLKASGFPDARTEDS